MSERRSVWNAVALVLTLGLAAAVAVVAVTRSSHESTAPSPSPSPTPSPTPTIGTPSGLVGEGPYLVYATPGGVFAYDVASGQTIPLGAIDGKPVTQRSRQPGAGRLVAFATQDGSVWSVRRVGMTRVGAIPPDAGDSFEGSAVSPDDRRIAIAAMAPDPATVLVDLASGASTVIERIKRGQYPPEALLPIAWSLGGGIVYQIPFCQCDGGSPGLYALDVNGGGSTIVPGTRTTTLSRFVVSASGQSLFYGTGTSRRCKPGELSPCDGPPFFLRRLAAGQRGPETLRRATDARFVPDAISLDGRLMLVTRIDFSTNVTRTELDGENGDRAPTIRGIPTDARPVALLPRDVVVATTSSPWSIVVVRSGRAETIVQTSAPDDAAVYLGWLR